MYKVISSSVLCSLFLVFGSQLVYVKESGTKSFQIVYYVRFSQSLTVNFSALGGLVQDQYAEYHGDSETVRASFSL